MSYPYVLNDDVSTVAYFVMKKNSQIKLVRFVSFFKKEPIGKNISVYDIHRFLNSEEVCNLFFKNVVCNSSVADICENFYINYKKELLLLLKEWILNERISYNRKQI